MSVLVGDGFERMTVCFKERQGTNSSRSELAMNRTKAEVLMGAAKVVILALHRFAGVLGFGLSVISDQI